MITDIKKQPKITSQRTCLNQLFIDLSKFGEPTLYKSKDGWNGRIEMFVTGKGVSFDIKSDYSMRYPIEAMLQVKERVEKTLKDLNK